MSREEIIEVIEEVKETGISVRAVNRNLTSMVDDGDLKMIGGVGKRSTVYVLAK